MDLRTHELRKHGLRIKLREKSFEILVCLLEHPNEVVNREELRRLLWPEDVFVNFDDSLNTAINRWRHRAYTRTRRHKLAVAAPAARPIDSFIGSKAPPMIHPGATFSQLANENIALVPAVGHRQPLAVALAAAAGPRGIARLS